MSIEFECPQCGKRLRVKDESAGKKASCPACRTIMIVPEVEHSEPEDPPPQTGANSPPEDDSGEFGIVGLPPLPQYPRGMSPPPMPTRSTAPPAPGGQNPYASPSGGHGGYSPAPRRLSGGSRNGPDWERGESFSSFISTVVAMVTNPVLFFRTMRRDGGMSSPINFALAASVPVGLEYFLFNLAVNLMGANQRLGNAGLFPLLLGAVCGFICFFLVFIPTFVLSYLFVESGLRHLFLMMLGGANFPFEATFRVTAYSMGATFAVAAIPCAGWLAAPVLMCVLICVGIAHTQEISIGKSITAFVLPLAVCGGIVVMIYVLIIVAILAQFQGA